VRKPHWEREKHLSKKIRGGKKINQMKQETSGKPKTFLREGSATRKLPRTRLERQGVKKMYRGDLGGAFSRESLARYSGGGMMGQRGKIRAVQGAGDGEGGHREF